MDFMDLSRRLYRWASEGVDMYGFLSGQVLPVIASFLKVRGHRMNVVPRVGHPFEL